MSTALLVTKQATISPAGLTGPSWAELREALDEADGLRQEIVNLTAQIESERGGRADSEQRLAKLERKFGILEFQSEHNREANVALTRHNLRMKSLLSGPTGSNQLFESGPDLTPRPIPGHPNKNSTAATMARVRARAYQTTLTRVQLRGTVWFDVGAWTIRDGDRFRSLSPLEYLTLVVLAENRGRRMLPDELGPMIFGADMHLLNVKNTLNARVQSLRSKLNRFGVRDLIPPDRAQGYFLAAARS